MDKKLQEHLHEANERKDLKHHRQYQSYLNKKRERTASFVYLLASILRRHGMVDAWTWYWQKRGSGSL